MKVRLKMMIQDPSFAPVYITQRLVAKPLLTKPLIEGYDVSGVELFSGPRTNRVVVEDLDPLGQPVTCAQFIPPKPGRKLGTFELPRKSDGQIDETSRVFNQVSVMATVLKTIDLYEDADVLGRPVRWNFDGPLTVMPRADVGRNAWYKRSQRRLEFWYFASQGQTVYTSLSRDVVAHETGHAILDGIAPHLMDTLFKKPQPPNTPESLALHEAIADITALLIAVSSSILRREVLAKTRGSIANAQYFSGIGEQFGMTALGSPALRDLRNEKTMKDRDVTRADHYSLCVVLTGALYSVLMKMHEKRLNAYSEDQPATEDKAATRYRKSGKALWDSAQQFKRMTLRALDYLPPGDATFVDYARAVIASDQASHPDDSEERGWLKEEFVRRSIVPDQAALEVKAPDADFGDVDLHALLNDDATARSFVENCRDLLGIPAGSEFQVGPRLEVSKKYYHRVEGEARARELTVTECLLKVWWSDPKDRISTVGTTLAIQWDTKRPRVLLTSSHIDRAQEGGEQQADRAGLAGPRLGLTDCTV